MSTKLALIAAVGNICLLWGTAGCSTHAPLPEEAEPTVRKISLDSVYSTSGQQGLKHVGRRLDELGGPEVQTLGRDFRGGASNLFLVRGNDIAAAVKATYWALNASQWADVVVDPEDKSKSQEVWMVVYFGTAHSTPTAWVVESVERNTKLYRVSFLMPEVKQMTCDLQQYFVWVPLGKLGPGTYTLELYDAGQKQLNMMRRVKVPGQED